MRTIAIGDIHGCSAALATLIEVIDPQPDDCIVTLGDYIDRGPASREVIEQLLALRERCQLIPLLGNHEHLLLMIERGDCYPDFWLQVCGGDATVASYGGRYDNIPASHWEFFHSCRRFHETQTHLFVHANYDPAVPLDEQSEELLLWTHLRIIPGPHTSGKPVFVGHTPQTSGRILDCDHVICIDTCCFGPGCLTAYEVETRSIWQAEKGGVLLKNGVNSRE